MKRLDVNIKLEVLQKNDAVQDECELQSQPIISYCTLKGCFSTGRSIQPSNI